MDAWRVDEAHRLAARGEQQQKQQQQHQQRTRQLFARADSLRPAVGMRTGGPRGEAPSALSRQTKPRTRPTSASCAPPTPALQVWWPACGTKATAWAMPRPRRLSSRGAQKRTGTSRGGRGGVCCCGCSSASATSARRLPRGARVSGAGHCAAARGDAAPCRAPTGLQRHLRKLATARRF